MLIYCLNDNDMLKKIVLCVSFVLGIFVSNAQQVAIDFSRDVLYEKLSNDLTITAEELPCKALWLTSSRGVITGEDCKYTLISGAGSLEINVYYIDKKDTIHIGRFNEQVHKHMPLKASVAGKTSGFISKNLLKRTIGIRASISSSGFPCITYIVASYFIFVTRDTQLIYFEEVKGNRFSERFKKACDTFQVGDEIRMCDLKIKSPTGLQAGNNVILKIQ